MKHKREAIHCAALFIAVLASYFNALSNTFAWDDIYLVTNNPLTLGWDRLRDIFSSGYWYALGKTGGLYRPLTILSFMAERSIGGTNPLVYHLNNVLLHAMCTLLVYFVLSELLPQGRAAFFGALIFAAHPGHSEAVAWVSGRAELLGSAFVLAGFLVYIRHDERPWRFVVMPVLFLLGLLSKETAAVLPLLILLHGLTIKKQRRIWALIKDIAPCLAVLAVYIPVRLLVLQGEAAPAEHMFKGITVGERFLMMLEAFLHYVRLSILPFDLRAQYMYAPPDPLSPQVLLSLLTFGLLIAATPYLLRRRPEAVFFIAWFFSALLPVANIIPTEVAMTERAMYLPLAGSCAAIGMALSGMPGSALRGFSNTLLAVTLACLAFLTISRNQVWKDNLTVHEELVEINMRLLDVFPGYVKSHLNLAQAYMVLGRQEEATAILEEAARTAPDDGNVQYTLASVYIERGLYGHAGKALAKAAALGFSSDMYYTNLAAVRFEEGDVDGAMRSLDKAIELNPRGALQLLNMGRVLLSKGETDAALGYMVRAGEADPFLYEAFLQQGMILGERKDFAGAAEALGKAVNAAPGNAEAHLYLGAALAAQGMNEQARMSVSRAMELAPGDTRARSLYESLR
ncbi:MAG: tetratricopeptide repeat protein [Nitrospirae bacterium]|nr:tetratricopeptide repeat protein [Nitrospirota bacterium]